MVSVTMAYYLGLLMGVVATILIYLVIKFVIGNIKRERENE